jgi:hypothetical protein
MALDLAAWREKQNQGEEAILPSGLKIRLKRVSLLDLASRGKIPTPLLTHATWILNGKEVKAEQAKDHGETLNQVFMACVVDPPVAEKPSDTHVGVEEFSIEDKIAVFKWSSEGTTTLAPFRSE